jgi:hypothetical protein
MAPASGPFCLHSKGRPRQTGHRPIQKGPQRVKRGQHRTSRWPDLAFGPRDAEVVLPNCRR